MMSALLSRCLILILGTLYPAYRSYKAIKNKDLREHVKWMMYWIVFALFTTLETFLDIFFSWFPFYYEIKILFILWVLSPATRGSSLLYKKVVHPMLISREKEIDELIEKTKQQGYTTFLQLFSSGFNYASSFFVNSAMRGQSLLGNQLKKSLSLNDVYENSTSVKNLTATRQQDAYSNRKPDTINEDEEEYNEFEREQIRRFTSSKHSNSKKSKSLNTNGHGQNRNSNKGSYELIDDDEDDDLYIEGHLDTRKLLISSDLRSTSAATGAATTTTTTTSRRKYSSKQLNPQQMNAGNYKSNEASHFGTITRGTKNKINSNLAAQTIFDNNDD